MERCEPYMENELAFRVARDRCQRPRMATRRQGLSGDGEKQVEGLRRSKQRRDQRERRQFGKAVERRGKWYLCFCLKPAEDKKEGRKCSIFRKSASEGSFWRILVNDTRKWHI